MRRREEEGVPIGGAPNTHGMYELHSIASISKYGRTHLSTKIGIDR